METQGSVTLCAARVGSTISADEDLIALRHPSSVFSVKVKTSSKYSSSFAPQGVKSIPAGTTTQQHPK